MALEASGTMCPILPKRTDIYYKWRPRSVCQSCGVVRFKSVRILKPLIRSMVA